MKETDAQPTELVERVVKINRVAKVVKGGKRFSFNAIVVVGDQQGSVGVGLGKANEVPETIRKGVELAKKNMIAVPIQHGTIPHEVLGRMGAAEVLLKPASSLRSMNVINVVRATMDALSKLRTREEIRSLRGLGVTEVDASDTKPTTTEIQDDQQDDDSDQ